MSSSVTESRSIKVRGTEYVVRELTAAEYDECLRKAAVGDDEVDTAVLAKFMAIACVEPKMTDVELGKMPFRIWRAINRVVNEVHYVPEDVEEGKDSAQETGSTGK